MRIPAFDWRRRPPHSYPWMARVGCRPFRLMCEIDWRVPRGKARRVAEWIAGLRGPRLVAAVGLLAACVPPRAIALRGLATTLALPRAEVPLGHTRIRFRWRYSDPNLELVGDGVARVASPDSARLDFFVDQGAGDRK